MDEYKWRKGRLVKVSPQITRWRKYLKARGVCAQKPKPKPVDPVKRRWFE